MAICEVKSPDAVLEKDIAEFLQRMKLLFKNLNRKRRAADEERLRHRVKALVEQQRKIFLQDYPEDATREQGLFLFERIADGLDHSLEAKAIRDEMLALTVEFGLDGEPNERISDYDGFKTRLKVLKDALAINREGRGGSEAAGGVAVEKPRTGNGDTKPKARKPRARKAAMTGADTA